MFKILLSALLLMSGCIGGSNPALATVSTNITKVQYAGDNVSTSFNFGTGGYSVPVYLNTDIQVYIETNATGAIQTLTLNNQYSVTLTQVPYSLTNTVVYYTAVINLAGGSSPWGALQSGTTLILNRSIPYTNLLNIVDYSSTPAFTWNQGYDRATMLSQQLYTLTQQAVLQPVSATTPISIPSALNGYILCWSGTSLSNCANNGSGTPIAIPIPNSDLATLTTAGLVNGSSITGTAALTSLTTTGNVGVGSSNPGQVLDVQGTIRGVGGLFSGNVGIGSVNPGLTLDVNGTVRASGFMSTGQFLNYGSSASAGTTLPVGIKVAYGTLSSVGTGGTTVTNLPFTNSSSYVVLVTVASGNNVVFYTTIVSASSFTITANASTATAAWLAIGY